MKFQLMRSPDACENYCTRFRGEIPESNAKAGGDKSLQKRCNEQQGIFHNRPVYAPAPLADDQAMRAAARKLLNGRTIDVAVPTADGYSGAAWDFRDVCRDVFKGVAGKREEGQPRRDQARLARLRRAQLDGAQRAVQVVRAQSGHQGQAQ